MDWKEAIENPRTVRLVREDFEAMASYVQGLPLELMLSSYGQVYAQRLELLRRELEAALAKEENEQPPGTGWEFIGTWPGDETEEELLALLKEHEK